MDKIDYLLIKDFLPQNEFETVLMEMDFLRKSGQLVTPEQSGAARLNGQILKKNKAIFLTDVYRRPEYSPILALLVKKYFQGVTMDYSAMSLWNRGILKTNLSTTMVSYYEDSDLYLPHEDVCVVTLLYWAWKEPKSFTGGDFILHDTDETIPVTNNTLLVFPGHCLHSVTPVVMGPDAKEGFGRWCVTTFLLTATTTDICFENYYTDGKGHHNGLL